MLIPFAKRKTDGILVDANDVPRGKACGCVCPECGRDLVAKHCVSRVDHFAHLADVECSITYESAVHLAAKQAITELGFIPLIGVNVLSATTGQKLELPALDFHFKSIEVEKFISDIKPDLILYGENDAPLAVEITYRHPTEFEKLMRYKELNVSCIEINLSELTPDTRYSRIRELIRDGLCKRNWLYNRKVERFWKEDLKIADKITAETKKREATIIRIAKERAIKVPVVWRKTQYRLYPIPHTVGCPLKKKEYDGRYFANVNLDCRKGCRYFFGTLPKYSRNYDMVRCGGSAALVATEKLRVVTIDDKQYELRHLNNDDDQNIETHDFFNSPDNAFHV